MEMCAAIDWLRFQASERKQSSVFRFCCVFGYKADSVHQRAIAGALWCFRTSACDNFLCALAAKTRARRAACALTDLNNIPYLRGREPVGDIVLPLPSPLEQYQVHKVERILQTRLGL